VTGGAGFLGSRLVRSFLGSGMRVRAAGHLSAGSPWAKEPLPKGLEFHEVELSDADRLAEVFVGQELVIHTAAVTRANSPAERRAREEVNVTGTRNTVDACRRAGVRTLLHVSTTAAIGISSDPRAPADEAFQYNMGHLALSYGSSKHRAEQIVLQANGTSLETIVVNPGFVFGRQGEGFRGQQVIQRVLRARVVLCTAGGLSMVHVEDVVDGIRKVVDRGRPGERYILSGENVSFRGIADTVCQVFGRRRPVISVPSTVSNLVGRLLNSVPAFRESGRYLYLHPRYAYPYYRSDKARKEVGYQSRSFQRIVADYLDHSRTPGAEDGT